MLSLRRRFAARSLLALMLLLAGCHVTPDRDAALRIVTWNIHHARGLDKRVDVGRIADELRALDADLVLLQEVDVGARRSAGADIPSELAARLEMHAAFEKNIDYQGGEYGNAILSRWPVVTRENLHYAMLRPGERRGLLTVSVDAPDGPLAIGCTHIDAREDDAERLQNVGEILATVAARDLLAVGGDFNDLPESRVHGALCGPLLDCWVEAGARAGGETYPADAPRKRIDWLLRSPDCGWRTELARVVRTAASDHRAVVFDLRRVR